MDQALKYNSFSKINEALQNQKTEIFEILLEVREVCDTVTE